MSSPSGPLDFILTARGLANVSRPENDFTFVVGDVKYACSTDTASFLSPIIASGRRADPTMREYAIRTPDPDRKFSDFLSLGRGSRASISRSSEPFMRSLCSELGNAEMMEAILDWFSPGLTIGNALGRLSVVSAQNGNVDQILSFVASHFEDFMNSDSEELTSSMAYAALSRPDVRLPNEDSLYRFLARRVVTDLSYFHVFECVQFAYLSSESMSGFTGLISDSFDNMTLALWHAINNRLVLSVADPPRTVRFEQPGREFSIVGSHSMDGIIQFLSRECQGNVHRLGIVDITASSVYLQYEASNAADIGVDSYFASENRPDQWICYAFKNRRVRVTDYSIQSQFNAGVGQLQPRHWVLEGSDDGNLWTELDRQQGDSSLNGPNRVSTFHLMRQTVVRIIRLRQIGVNHSGSNYFVIGGFELFGTLFQNS
jgi:hypothetical protein